MIESIQAYLFIGALISFISLYALLSRQGMLQIYLKMLYLQFWTTIGVTVVTTLMIVLMWPIFILRMVDKQLTDFLN